MKLYSWNVNSLRACEDQFLKFIKKYEPDIIGLQELRAHPDQLSFFLKSIQGYNSFFHDSGRPGYAGTALYYKDSLPVTEVTNDPGDPFLCAEGRVIKIQIKDLNIYNFYTPNGNSSEKRLKYKLKYYSHILALTEQSIERKEKVIIGGDLNVAHTQRDLYLKNPRSSGFLPEERKWFSNMLKAGLTDSFRKFNKEGGNYTWWHFRDKERKLNNGWRFDYFLVSKNIKIKGAGILKDVFGSDHCPIWVEI
jgi:exodeoxyribonuclease-3